MKCISLILAMVMASSAAFAKTGEITAAQRMAVLNGLSALQPYEQVLAQAELTPQQAIEVLKDARIIDDQFIAAVQANPEAALNGQIDLPQGNDFYASDFGAVCLVWMVAIVVAGGVAVAAL